MHVISKYAIAAVAATAVACTVTGQPAFAQSSATFHGTSVAADNNPGSGSAGWVWVYGSAEYKATGGTIEYEKWDGSKDELSVGRKGSQSRDLNQKVKGFRACTNWYIDGYDLRTCGDWYYFA
ncbi:hypothetical protein AB0J83_17515 [Actinoplanes sp. NPDC049596]|uniref:hypothetical protein n=1 Tax=unclassified Actinoplanes TaxID=2626549 RepID=UPI003440A062